jgi:hypothetical protein
MNQDSRSSDISVDRCGGFEHDYFVGGDITGYDSSYLDRLGVDIRLDHAALSHSNRSLAVDCAFEDAFYEDFPGSQELALDAGRSCDDRLVSRLRRCFYGGLR